MADVQRHGRCRAAQARRPSRPQLPVSWYFDPEIFEQEKKLLFQAGSNYVGHELMVPKVGDYHTLAHTDHSKVLVRNESRRRAAVERLPPPPVDHARGPRQHREHRLPAAPLDLRPERRAARRAALPRDPVRQAALDAAHQLERPAVRRAARPAQGSRAHHHHGRLGFQRLRARLGARRRIRHELEDLRRDLPRGLPRQPVPPGPGQLHRLRELHRRLRRGVLDPGRRRQGRPGAARHAGLPQMARGLPQAARRRARRSTARCGRATSPA